MKQNKLQKELEENWASSFFWGTTSTYYIVNKICFIQQQLLIQKQLDKVSAIKTASCEKWMSKMNSLEIRKEKNLGYSHTKAIHTTTERWIDTCGEVSNSLTLLSNRIDYVIAVFRFCNALIWIFSKLCTWNS